MTSSYNQAGSFTRVETNPYQESVGLILSPKPTKHGLPISSPLLLNGKNTPIKETYTPIRRDSQDPPEQASPESTTPSEEAAPAPIIPTKTALTKPKNSNATPERWFNSLINHRKLISGVWTGLASYVIIFGVFVAIQVSLWSPFQSIIKMTSAIFSPKVHIFVLFASILQTISSFLVAKILATVVQNKRTSIAYTETWISFLISLGFSLVIYIFGYIIFYDYSKISNENVFHFVFFIGLAIGTAVNIFNHDYQLIFGGVKIKSTIKTSKIKALVQNISNSAKLSCLQGVKVLACASILSIIIVPIFYGFSGWLFLFNMSAHYALIVAFTAQVLIGHVFHRTLRQTVLEPINFNFLPRYNVACPTPEQERNMASVLTSGDMLLNLFGMYDLRFMVWFDPTRRSEVFILSQPAGNPKNWKSVFNPSVRFIDEMKAKIDEAKIKIGGPHALNDSNSGEISDDEEYITRNMLMMPRSSREQMYSIRTRRRHQTKLKPIKNKPVVPAVTPTLAEKIARWSLHPDETGAITRYEAEITIFAIESLEMLVIVSIAEDVYGVVQKDLQQIIRSMLSLHTSIDRFLRIKAASQGAIGNENLLRGVEDVLVSSISRIGEKFSGSIGFIELSNIERAKFQGITNQPTNYL